MTLGAASLRQLLEACVRAVQPAVAVPIELHVDAAVPELVRAKPAACARVRVCSYWFLRSRACVVTRAGMSACVCARIMC